MSDLYGTDLAWVHDAYYAGLARDAAAVLGLRLPSRGRVVDVGCGSGTSLANLPSYDAYGIDTSSAMLELAHAARPDGTFVRGDWQSAEIPAAVAVLAVGEVLSYTEVPLGHAARRAFFRRAFSSLSDGGWLLFDLIGPERIRNAVPQRHYLAKDAVVLVDASVEASSGLLVREITTFRRDGEFYQRSFERHAQEALDPDSVHTALLETGFSVERLEGYGDRPSLPGVQAFLAQK